MRTVAAIVAILCLQAAAQEPAACIVGGSVTDDHTGKPVERARVIAQGTSYSLLRLTNADGGFCFDQLTPGDYHVVVQKTGYSEVQYPVTLALESDSPLKPLAIRMTRYGSLSGTVLDADGELLPGATVTVYERTRSGPDEVSDVTTDTYGRFHISQLSPGTYYLSAKYVDQRDMMYSMPTVDSHGQMPREKEVETFYSASFTFAGATAVEVKPGQHLDGLVLGLKKAHLRRVSGRVVDLAHGPFLTYNSETETSSDRGGLIPIAGDGSFVKADLPPAKYTFELGDGKKTIARKDVDLTLGDALNITLYPVDTVDIPAVIRTEGKGPAFLPHAGSGELVLFQDGSDRGTALEAAGDGTYHFPSMVRDVYRLELWGKRLYLKSVTYGGETQTASKLDLRGDRPGGLEITLSSNVAEVDGKVTLPEEEVGDLTVILVDGAHVVQEARTDQKGRFRISSVAPGKYRLFAIEDFDDDWSSPELAKTLEAKSVQLELKENEKKQLSVPAISAGEWAAALKKLGG